MLPKGTKTNATKRFCRHKANRITKLTRRCKFIRLGGKQVDCRSKPRRRDHAPSPNFRLTLNNDERPDSIRRKLFRCNVSVPCIRTAKRLVQKAKCKITCSSIKPLLENHTQRRLTAITANGACAPKYGKRNTINGNMPRGRKRKRTCTNFDIVDQELRSNELSNTNTYKKQAKTDSQSPLSYDEITFCCNQKSHSSSCFTTLETVNPTIGTEPMHDPGCDTDNMLPYMGREYPYDQSMTSYWNDPVPYGYSQKSYSPSCFTTLDIIHPTMGRELINDEECDAEIEAIMCSKKHDQIRPYDCIQTPYWNDHITYCSLKPYTTSCFTSLDTINPTMGTALINDVKCDTEVAAIMNMNNSTPFDHSIFRPFQEHSLNSQSDCRFHLNGHMNMQCVYQQIIKNAHGTVMRTSTSTQTTNNNDSND